MAKTKVLHIVKSLDRGGAEILLLETLKLHNKGEFEFFYIYFRVFVFVKKVTPVYASHFLSVVWK